MKTIYEAITEHAKKSPNVTAFIEERKEISYQCFLQEIDEVRYCIKNEKPLNIVLIESDIYTFLTRFIAAVSLGHNVQVFDPNWPAAFMSKTLQYLNPDIVMNTDWVPKKERSNQSYKEQPDNAFYTGFTSGSTGIPKGFVRSQTSWLKSFAADQDLFQFSDQDRFAIIGPMAHSLFLYAAIRGVYQGGTLLLCPTFHPAKVAKQIQKHKASILFAVPAQTRALMDIKVPFNSVRHLLVSGAKFPVKWADDVSSIFPKATATEFFGASETSYIAHAKISSKQEPLKLFKDVEVTTENDADIGALFIKSPYLFNGYAGPCGQVHMKGCKVNKEGAISIGDTGGITPNGTLKLIGRTDRLFQSSARNIIPEEIENAILSYPNLTHVAVFGEEDVLRGKRVAMILPEGAKGEVKAILTHIRTKLPLYCIPSRIYIAQTWPQTRSFKTDLTELLQRHTSGKLERIL